MKVIITGGTGFLGGYLVKELLKRGDSVIILSRNPEKYESANSNLTYEGYDAVDEVVDGSDVVINLAGYNLFDKKWTDEIKSAILKSRVNTTRKMVDGIKKAKKKPSVFISASAVGYYGSQRDTILTEKNSSGDDYLSRVCVQWEEEARKLDIPNVRVCIPRLGILLEKDGGALDKMITPFNLFIGGPLGSGHQYFPWIHMQDTVNALLFAIQQKDFSGVFNVTAPVPVTMSVFAKELGSAMSRPSLFKVPEFALKVVLGEAAEALTASQRVIPQKLLDAGFTFAYKKAGDALKSILNS